LKINEIPYLSVVAYGRTYDSSPAESKLCHPLSILKKNLSLDHRTAERNEWLAFRPLQLEQLEHHLNIHGRRAVKIPSNISYP
jgi:hypothetical protein